MSTEAVLVELKNAGDKVTMVVESVTKVPVGKYPEIEYLGTDTTTGETIAVRMPKSSSDRQLTRCNLTEESAVGCTLTLKRDPNAGDPSKPWWGIWKEKDGNGGAGPRTAADGGSTNTRVQNPSPAPSVTRAQVSDALDLEPDGFAEQSRLYLTCLCEAKNHLTKVLGANVPADVIVAAAATLFIQACKR